MEENRCVMKTETREIYKCEYCNKLYQRKHACIIHEKGCTKNPNNFRACFGCANLSNAIAKRTFDTPFGEGSEDVNVLYCSKKDHFLYPPKVEAKGNWFELDEINEPMPMKCYDYMEDRGF